MESICEDRDVNTSKSAAAVVLLVLFVLFLSPIRATCPAHLILLDLINRITFGEEHRS
jgi:hypothetical protein